MTLVRYHNILIGSIHYHFILSRKLTIAIVQNNEGGQSFLVQINFVRKSISKCSKHSFISYKYIQWDRSNYCSRGPHVPVTSRRLNLTWTYRTAFAQWERYQVLRGKTSLRSSSDWPIAETEALAIVYRIELADQECGCGSILPAWLALDLVVFLPCEALWGHVGLQVIVGKIISVSFNVDKEYTLQQTELPNDIYLVWSTRVITLIGTFMQELWFYYFLKFR